MFDPYHVHLSQPGPDEIWESAAENRPRVHAVFPHVVTVGHHYPAMDRAVRWCWMTFGARHGQCDDNHSDYPACPLVLAAKRFVYPDDPEDEPAYEPRSPVPDHCHIGTWTTLWLGKTGYDYGNQDYCFSTQQQKELFLGYVALIGGHEPAA